MREHLPRILVVDDEPQIRRFLRTTLTAQGHSVVEAATGQEAILKTSTDRPDVVILDLGLPDMDGMEVIHALREWSAVVLTVRGRETDKIMALDAGADDYVTKPFGMGELLARIRTSLRHRLTAQTDQPVFESGNLAVDLSKRLVLIDGREIRLTPTEYDLLRVLVINAGKVVTHQHLLREVWGPSDVDQTQYLRVYIGQLRQKIEADTACPQHILTEPGVGYRLRARRDEDSGKE